MHFVVPYVRAPETGSDWYYPMRMERGKDAEDISAVRAVGAEIVEKIKEEQAQRIKKRALRIASRAKSNLPMKDAP